MNLEPNHCYTRCIQVYGLHASGILDYLIAKGKGYVEADESLDLDGFDAAAKLTILANWIMDMRVTWI